MGKLAKSILYAVIPRDKARTVISIVTLSNRAFMGFVTGQCVEVILIGVLCFIGMLIFGMPHPLMVSCVIAVTAFIPVFGPVVGSVIGAFLILIVDPMKALWFLIFIIVLQQLESNIIYPRIMGKHVNLPGVWVLVAVTIGGGLWGMIGIVVSIPLCSVFYTLFQKWLIKRLEDRNVCHVTMSHDSSEPNFIFIEESDESPVGTDDEPEVVVESAPTSDSNTDDSAEARDASDADSNETNE
jgi:predicted PurR-regulated permease PerM